jgi:hypothetical protein
MKKKMARQSLHERQHNVLAYLTNPRKFDGDPAELGLEGMDLDRLRLMGTMSLGKRIDKIHSALPRTFEYLANDSSLSISEFASQYPPLSATRADNAIQFIDYLHGVWCEEPVDPAFLPDLVALELAMAIATAVEPEDPETDRTRTPRGSLRLPPGTQLLRCRFDIRPLFDNSVERRAPIERNLCLVVVMPADAQQPRVFEVKPDAYAMLKRIRLAEANNSTAGCASGVSRRLVDDLIQREILEVQE